jgi:hypothetical protein
MKISGPNRISWWCKFGTSTAFGRSGSGWTLGRGVASHGHPWSVPIRQSTSLRDCRWWAVRVVRSLLTDSFMVQVVETLDVVDNPVKYRPHISEDTVITSRR